jgi:hypothetical protein
MKALTIKQPWATLIMTGAKDVENRLWHTNFRGRIAIHSSKKMDPQETLSAARLMAEFIPGFSVDKFCIEAKLKPELYPCGPQMPEPKRLSPEAKGKMRRRNLERRQEKTAPMFASDLIQIELQKNPEYYAGIQVRRQERPSINE